MIILEDSVNTLNKSKLQICTEILCNLASNGPMNLSKISEKFSIKGTHLKKHLKLLEDSSLVIRENFGKNKIFFTVTENGRAVLKIFRPLIKEKYYSEYRLKSNNYSTLIDQFIIETQ